MLHNMMRAQCHVLYLLLCVCVQFGRQEYVILRPFKEVKKLIDGLSSHGGTRTCILAATHTHTHTHTHIYYSAQLKVLSNGLMRSIQLEYIGQ